MNEVEDQFVNVFPISTAAFGLRADWFETFSPKLVQPTYLLMALFLIVAIGVMVLKRFEDADLEKKVWNLPIIITMVVLWPFIVVGLKDLVDTFNTFLVRYIFQIPWVGFGFPEMGSITNIIGWSAEGLARLLPNLSYWIVYGFYIVFFFFFAVLGPFILAKGILYDEIEAFLELSRELIVLFLWQTTVVILVAFIMPEIVSGKPFPPNPESNLYFLSLILGIMILFTPAMTRKFGNHLGSTLLPPGFKWGGAALGISALAFAGSRGLSAAGLTLLYPGQTWQRWKHRILVGEEFIKRNQLERQKHHLEYQVRHLQKELREHGDDAATKGKHHADSFIHLSKRATHELRNGGKAK